MLVSFSVQNYRSFSAKQTLSMVAGTGSGRKRAFSFPTGNSMAPNLLRSACIFGPNGAGKSSLVMAVGFFKSFVIHSAKESQLGESIDVNPFKIDKQWFGEPTEMEAMFIFEGTFYQYGFAVDEHRVWAEWLFTKPDRLGSRVRKVFQRAYDKESDAYEWEINKTQLKGPTDVWKEATRVNALFFSTAVQLNAESLAAPLSWLQQCLRIILSPGWLSPNFTAKQCINGAWTKKVLGFLQSTGLPVVDLDIKTEEKDVPDSELEQPKNNKRKKRIEYEVILYYRGKGGEKVPMDLSEESDGTQVLFRLAGPWIDVLERGMTLFVDELHNSLHPHALRSLVDLFHNPDINSHNAQLIFTSHETSIMSKGLMHQDQIWVVEKSEEQASTLFPLSAFNVRDTSAFQKAYLDGRFGGLPNLQQSGVWVEDTDLDGVGDVDEQK